MRYLFILFCITAMAADVRISALPQGNPYSVSINDSFPYVDANVGVTKKLKINDIAHLSAFSTYRRSVVNGGNSSYSIMFGEYHVRTGSALTASRSYKLPSCSGSNIGEQHSVKNVPASGFSVFVTTSNSDTIDTSATRTLYSGSAVSVICGESGKWDIQNAF